MKLFKTALLAGAFALATTVSFAQVGVGVGTGATGGANIGTGSASTNMKSNTDVNANVGGTRAKVGADASGNGSVRRRNPRQPRIRRCGCFRQRLGQVRTRSRKTAFKVNLLRLPRQTVAEAVFVCAPNRRKCCLSATNRYAAGHEPNRRHFSAHAAS